MARIAVFDSGLGSLSVIKAIQKICKSEIIYFADQQNFPYGEKSQAQLSKIIQNSIKLLQEKFSPDVIVVASNTPSLMLDVTAKKIVDVKPPLKEARKQSKTKQIGILSTKSAINSKGLTQHIKKSNLTKDFKIFKINASDLVEIVESGKFVSNKKYCQKIIKNMLDKILSQNNIDTITLSSTHLPFLLPLLKKQYPGINFIDPADMVAKKIFLKIKNKQSRKNSLKIFATGDTRTFQTKLNRIGIKNKVSQLSF
ncbi:MAG: aspartate/glutamate racemase family protein [Nitrosopumilus sp.]|nr:aspartate/glutamate racemase family protein [Nitrosopumilus sp.]MDF2423320.1 aspartate/glutamate racemase family protein [Nitrosopumilus sp.]MDF2424530.1 aspartate/glutamate racemase family protein [Nitrosopumilus sp.]MDF2425233.1 aspartate/glutamate racemase family protein [Nitrosopumilus sp.]MDF2426909.1 aspartate/glutamate racemase family protein [Nitrosopumilus sp.]